MYILFLYSEFPLIMFDWSLGLGQRFGTYAALSTLMCKLPYVTIVTKIISMGDVQFEYQ